MSTRTRDVQAGFTMVEVMITLVVIAILAAVAVPAYGEYVLRASRGEAAATLVEASQYMQRFYAENDSYQQDINGNAVALPAVLTRSARNGVQRYAIRFQAAPTDDAFTLEAVPVGPSSSDKCGTLSLTSIGTRDASGDSADNCWR